MHFGKSVQFIIYISKVPIIHFCSNTILYSTYLISIDIKTIFVAFCKFVSYMGNFINSSHCIIMIVRFNTIW